MSIDDPNVSGGNQSAPDSELRNRATQDLDQLTSKAKGDLDAMAQRATTDARELGGQVREKVGEATDQAKSFATDQKSLAADQINGVAAAISKVADELHGSKQRVVAKYARDLAGGLSSVGKTIDERDVDDLMGLAQDFGRKQPVAFLGAAALAGFVASRFALASTHRRENKGATPANLAPTSGVRPTNEKSDTSPTGGK